MQEARQKIESWADRLEKASKRGGITLYMEVLKIIPNMRELARKRDWVQEPFADEDEF